MGDRRIEPAVSVILINYNGGHILPVIQQSIEGVRCQGMSDWELVLVDDGSTDGSSKFLASFDDGKRVHFVRTTHRGVGAARNAGLRIAQGRYLAFLDNDAVPAADWLEHMVTFLGAHPEHGAAAPLVFFADRPGVVNSAGSVMNELAHGTGVGMHELYPFCALPDEVMYPTGNGMVIRRQALDKVGWFDEGFLFYGHDDSDMGVRIRNAGYSVAPIRDAFLFHLHSTSKREPGMGFWDQRNRLRFALKHYSIRELVSFALVDARSYFGGPSWHEYMRAWSSALRGWGQLCRQRTRWREERPYFERFALFFSPERRYIRAPNNRDCAQVWRSMDQGLTVGTDEESYLYQGWYRRERRQGRLVRWAMPVASLRFIAPRPVDKFVLSLLLPPPIEQLHLRVHFYPWSEQWYLSPPAVSAEIVVKGDEIRQSVIRPSSWSCVGKCLMVFEATQYFQESGYFPRRLAWGLVGLEVHACVS